MPERFAAFISYSHKDEQLAKWLHRKLEAYRIPQGVAPSKGVPGLLGRRVGKIFRDREEFAAGGELKQEMERALARSDCLIVLCSRHAAASPYVELEIRYFLGIKPGQQLIPVIVDTDPPACFPAALRQGPERLGADLRKDKDGRDAGLLKILAGMLGIGHDDLFRRQRRRQRAALLGLGALVLFFAGVAAVAVWQTIEANAQRRMAQANAERAEQALARLFVQRTMDPTIGPAARARYALAGLQLFPAAAPALRLGLGATLQDQGRLLQTFQHSAAPAVFLASGDGVILRSRDGHIAEWDARTGQRGKVLVQSVGEVRAMALSAGAALLAVADSEGTVRVLDRVLGREIWREPTDVGMAWSMAWSPDGRLLAVAGESGAAELRDAQTGQLLHKLQPERLALYGIAFSASGELLATASHSGEAQIWRAQGGTLLHRLAGHGDRLRSLLFVGRGTRLATASMDGTVRLWDAASGVALRTLEGHGSWVDALAVDSAGTLLVSGSSDGTARIWNADSGAAIATLPKFDGPVYGVAIDAGGTRVAAVSADGTATLADAQSGTVLSRLRAHEGGPVYAAAFSGDGKLLYTDGAVQTLRIWDAQALPAAAPAQTPGPVEHKTVQTKVDRGLVFADDGGKVRITELATRKLVATLEGHTSKVSHVAVSGDGRTIATASMDNTARIWRRDDSRTLAVLRGHVFPLELVALSSDDRLALTASRDATARLWDVATGQELMRWQGVRWMDTLGFSSQGDTVLAAGEGRSFAWDISRLAWPLPQATAFACERLLAPAQALFTTEEQENDPLVRDVWLPRRRGKSSAVCAS